MTNTHKNRISRFAEPAFEVGRCEGRKDKQEERTKTNGTQTNHVLTSWASSRQLFSHHSLKRTLFQIIVPSILGKGNSHWAIVKPSDSKALASLVMTSSSCMAISILLAKLKNWWNISSGKSGAPHTAQIWHPIWVPNTHMEQLGENWLISTKPG
ncbi:hypothetical protein AVEN_101532-1 [Araneus ventricosus]|uniref:Uncharacterized protein n=1 Tax=Araneus ventricosus TaxID=182803 RepID=A0A4Y2GR92_ARAVE|nr:hypothetical protein AVEN_101532-1 [Araneus ventricosus]